MAISRRRSSKLELWWGRAADASTDECGVPCMNYAVGGMHSELRAAASSLWV